MRKKVLFAACVAISIFAPALFAAEEAGVRVFILKYRQVEEAALLIRPHLSPAGTVTLTPRLKAIWACRCGARKCVGTMLKPKRKPAKPKSARKA